MIHFLLPWHHGRQHMRNWANMSFKLAAVSAAEIYPYPLYTSGWYRLELKSPVTSSSDPWGCSLSTVTTLYIIEVLSGAR